MGEFLPNIDDLHHQFHRLNPESCGGDEQKGVSSPVTAPNNSNSPCNLLKQYLIPVELCIALYVDEGTGKFEEASNSDSE
jgi:hypothetical protein